MERKLQRYEYSHNTCSAPNCRRRAFYHATISNGQYRNKCEKHALQYAVQYEVEHPGVKYKPIRWKYENTWVRFGENLHTTLKEFDDHGWEVISIIVVDNVTFNNSDKPDGRYWCVYVRKRKQ